MGTVAEQPVKTETLHDRDFHAWTQEQAVLLRAGNFESLDVLNLIEEVEDMGKSQASALDSAIEQALIHLIKLSYSPSDLPRGQRVASVVKQRVAIERVLRKNPGLQSTIGEAFSDAWSGARKIAIAEMAAYGESPSVPDACPFSISQLRDKEFQPLKASVVSPRGTKGAGR